jgi:hypothetical protein
LEHEKENSSKLNPFKIILISMNQQKGVHCTKPKW